jgi:membrane protease YdiL (CAAX protease family)
LKLDVEVAGRTQISPGQALIEAFVGWAVVVASASIFYQLAWSGFVFFQHHLLTLTTALLMYIPMAIFFIRKEPIDFLEKNLSHILFSMGWLLRVVFILGPAIILVNHFYQGREFHLSWDGFRFYKPVFQYVQSSSHFLWPSILRNLVIATGEEFFFRGYLQKRFHQVFGNSAQFLVFRSGKPLFLTAAVFALSHSLITLQWWHPFIFFPGLIFGWLREKTNGLVAPVFFHVLCNVFSEWVGVSYRR